MSTGRILSTAEAGQAIQQIQSILDGDLTGTIQKLDAQGKQLSDPNVWDGPLANEFRNTVWPSVNSTLSQTVSKLTDLRNQLQRIHADIQQAGGGS